ncbi:MAG: aromatic ring-hydroxylating oxygenase subunit alpha [Actinomycetota bacterium]
MTQPAPIDVQQVSLCAQPFYEARTLPGAAYHSDELLAWEREHFFRTSWVCVGRADDLAEPGSQKAVEAGGTGILLIRGDDHELRAFHNTCRHRGHELLVCGASTQRKTVQCPYHRWTYGLDGTFKGGPTMAIQPGFDKTDSDHSLRSAAVREWHGWVFINASGDAPDFDTYVGNLDELMAPYEPGRMFVGASHSYEIEANWKIIVENYHECYHCTEIHPELCAVSSPTSGEGIHPTGVWVGGTMTLRDGVETMSLDGQSGGVRIRGLYDDAAKDVGYYMLWPNVLISPHPDYVMTHRIEPRAPGRTFVECQWLFPPESNDRADFDSAFAADFWDVTNRQDWNACEAVQRGSAGPGYRQGPFSEQEVQVYEFDLMVAQGYLTGEVREPVPHFTDARR